MAIEELRQKLIDKIKAALPFASVDQQFGADKICACWKNRFGEPKTFIFAFDEPYGCCSSEDKFNYWLEKIKECSFGSEIDFAEKESGRDILFSSEGTRYDLTGCDESDKSKIKYNAERGVAYGKLVESKILDDIPLIKKRSFLDQQLLLQKLSTIISDMALAPKIGLGTTDYPVWSNVLENR